MSTPRCRQRLIEEENSCYHHRHHHHYYNSCASLLPETHNNGQALLKTIASTAVELLRCMSNKDTILQLHLLIHHYVTTNPFAMRPRTHYCSISRAVASNIVRCDGVPAYAKPRFLRAMEVVRNVFHLMYGPLKFRRAYAAQTDKGVYIDRVAWAARVAKERAQALSRCLLLCAARRGSWAPAEPLLRAVTRTLPQALWREIFAFVG